MLSLVQCAYDLDFTFVGKGGCEIDGTKPATTSH